MKVFGICLVKNEADIIEYSLIQYSNWADCVFVYDNGSTDGTWEIVKNVAEVNPKIVPFKSEARPFNDGLRAEVFNAFKYLAKPGDWWCVRCDSDEFYVDNPRVVLNRVSKFHHVVTSLHFEYRLTFEDVEEFTFAKNIVDILAQLRYYHPKQTSEIRFIKHRSNLNWPEVNYGFPKRKGIISPIKIRLKHYQYRTPVQIENRIAIRRQATKDGHKFFQRDNVSNWKDKLEKRSNLIFDDGTYRIGYIQDYNTTKWWKLLALHILHGLKLFK